MRNTVLIFFILFAPLLLVSDKACGEQSAEYALIITIDGLRPDAILKAGAPNLTALIKEGSYTPAAKTVDPPKTLHSHMSLITGLVPEKHGTYKNEWNPDMGYTEFETIFTIAKKEGFSTAIFAGKDKLNFIANPKSINKIEVINYSPTSVEEISHNFTSFMKENMPGVTLIHFPEPDIPGHKNGWMSEEYFDSIKNVDNQLGKIITSLKQAEVYDKTFIVITADHGGKDHTHRGNHPYVMTIPWIAVGKEIKTNYTIKEQIHIYDTAPTVLHALGIKPPKNMDGDIIKEIFTR